VPVFPRRVVRRTRTGRYSINLGPEERQFLAGLAPQLREVLATPDEPSLRRLFPPAFSGAGDAERQEEYVRLMRDDLVERHAGALEVLERTATASEVSADDLEAWARALNQIRLVLGTRLDVSEDDDPVQTSSDPDHQIYGFLSYLQECVIDALSDGD
jgi:hypothetical protein